MSTGAQLPDPIADALHKAETDSEQQDPPKKKGRGRPKGSKNKRHAVKKAPVEQDGSYVESPSRSPSPMPERTGTLTEDQREEAVKSIIQVQNIVGGSKYNNFVMFKETDLHQIDLELLSDILVEMTQKYQKVLSERDPEDMKEDAYGLMQFVELGTYSPIMQEKNFIQRGLWNIAGVGDLHYPVSVTESLRSDSAFDDALGRTIKKHKGIANMILQPEFCLIMHMLRIMQKQGKENEQDKEIERRSIMTQDGDPVDDSVSDD